MMPPETYMEVCMNADKTTKRFEPYQYFRAALFAYLTALTEEGEALGRWRPGEKSHLQTLTLAIYLAANKLLAEAHKGAEDTEKVNAMRLRSELRGHQSEPPWHMGFQMCCNNDLFFSIDHCHSYTHNYNWLEFISGPILYKGLLLEQDAHLISFAELAMKEVQGLKKSPEAMAAALTAWRENRYPPDPSE